MELDVAVVVAVVVGLEFDVAVVVAVVGFEFDVAVVVGLELVVEAGVDLVLVALVAEDAWACTARRETPAIAARAMEL